MNIKAYDQPTFFLTELQSRQPQLKLLLATPDYFDLVDEKNIYMKQNHIDAELAFKQWEYLKNVYLQLKSDGFINDVFIIPGAEKLEDMVFCCNPIFSWEVDGQSVVVSSNMKYLSRQEEVGHIVQFLTDKGYQHLELETDELFEGGGDAIPHPGKRLIWGGYGHRTEQIVYEELAQKLKTPIITLELVSPYFYHLDTCFAPLDEQTVFICPEAFNEKGLKAIHRVFKHVILVPYSDATATFSLNMHSLQHPKTQETAVIIHPSNSTVFQLLKEKNSRVIAVDTSEFMKSGGSVFCMKAMLS